MVKFKKKFTIPIVVLTGIMVVFALSSGTDQEQDVPNPRVMEWRHIHGLGLDPNDSNLLFIATHGDFYHSRNGSPPVKVDKIRADYMAFSAPYDKDAPLYASGHPSTGGNTGLIKSSDGGITWQQVATVLEPPVDFHAMAVGKIDPNLIMGFDSGNRGLFKTTDAGKTWITIDYPEYISALAISPHDSSIIFAGTANGIYKTNDGGKTWSHVSYKGLNVFALSFDEQGTLFGSVDTFGLVKSDDIGGSWENIPDIDLTVTSFALDHSNKIIYVGGYSSGGFQEVYKMTYDLESYDLIATNKRD
ncbi:MAG: hypothetical protein OEM28_07480 [Nitrosopumilus sp.]|nr:hypothetical protein [Nitrosopumilus sp.]MDH3488104.1 hypothetical protein [Nitrosopumilus sp.]